MNAYGRFKSLIKGVRVDINTTPVDITVVAKLNNEFEAFKANKRESLEANALYEILMKQYQDVH